MSNIADYDNQFEVLLEMDLEIYLNIIIAHNIEHRHSATNFDKLFKFSRIHVHNYSSQLNGLTANFNKYANSYLLTLLPN